MQGKIISVLIAINILCLLPIFSKFFKVSEVYQTNSKADFYRNLNVGDIQAQSSDINQYIRLHLDEMILYKDADGAVQLTRDAFRAGLINEFDCHSIAHMIGHHTVLNGHFDHIESHISYENINFCGAGFMHGVEDGLATYERLGFRNDMYRFCTLVKPMAKTYDGCYHGAGHAFFKKSADFKEALELCDTLIMDKDIGPELCYRGVFSGYLEKLKQSGKENNFLLGFCASLDMKFNQDCTIEINGFGINANSSSGEIEKAFKDCINNKYELNIKSACLRSVAWSATDIILAKENSIVPPGFILDLPKPLLQSYMLATTDGIKRYMQNGVQKEWQSFCASFPDKNDRIMCNNAITN